MGYLKIHNLRGTNAGKDLLIVNTCGRVKLLDFSNFERSAIIRFISLSFCSTNAIDDLHHTS